MWEVIDKIWLYFSAAFPPIALLGFCLFGWSEYKHYRLQKIHLDWIKTAGKLTGTLDKMVKGLNGDTANH